MQKRKVKKYILLVFGAVFITLFLGVVLLYSVIYLEVRKTCTKAQSEYKTNCIDSLIQVLDSDDKSPKEKNDAIWALGQIADRRSIPALEKIKKADVSEREPLDKVISQYEIRKAIHWTEGGNWDQLDVF